MTIFELLKSLSLTSESTRKIYTEGTRDIDDLTVNNYE